MVECTRTLHKPLVGSPRTDALALAQAPVHELVCTRSRARAHLHTLTAQSPCGREPHRSTRSRTRAILVPHGNTAQARVHERYWLRTYIHRETHTYSFRYRTKHMLTHIRRTSCTPFSRTSLRPRALHTLHEGVFALYRSTCRFSHEQYKLHTRPYAHARMPHTTPAHVPRHVPNAVDRPVPAHHGPAHARIVSDQVGDLCRHEGCLRSLPVHVSIGGSHGRCYWTVISLSTSRRSL